MAAKLRKTQVLLAHSLLRAGSEKKSYGFEGLEASWTDIVKSGRDGWLTVILRCSR